MPDRLLRHPRDTNRLAMEKTDDCGVQSKQASALPGPHGHQRRHEMDLKDHGKRAETDRHGDRARSIAKGNPNDDRRTICDKHRQHLQHL